MNPLRGKLEKRLHFHRAVEMKQPHTMTELFSKEVGMYDTGKAFYRHYEYIQRENSLYSRWFQKRGLSYPQFLILDAVLRSPEGAEPTALAEECFMPKQTLSLIHI